MKSLQILLAILMIISCREDECIFTKMSPISTVYLQVESVAKQKIIMPFSSLIIVTEFDYLDFSIGAEERGQIACRLKKSSAKEIITLQEESEYPIFVLKDIDKSSSQIKIYYNESLRANSLFDIQDFEFEMKGQLISRAIENNVQITFSDNEGVYLWGR